MFELKEALRPRGRLGAGPIDEHIQLLFLDSIFHVALT